MISKRKKLVYMLLLLMSSLTFLYGWKMESAPVGNYLYAKMHHHPHASPLHSMQHPIYNTTSIRVHA